MKNLLFLLCALATSAVFSSAHAANSHGKVLPLAFGVTNSGTISLPAQEDRFTFSGAIGQRLFYDALDLDFESIVVTILAPSGDTVNGFAANHSSDVGPVYLLETGTYTMILRGSGDATGDYSFRLLDLANATPISYGTTVTGQLAPQSRANAYRFEGTNGQRLLATNIAASSGNANWRLVTPANQALFHVGVQSTPSEVVLPVTGTYVVLVEGQVDTIGTLDFQFRVSVISEPSGGTTGFGTVRSGTTTVGQTNVFNYTAPAGTLVFVDALTNNAAATVYFFEPNGDLAASFSAASDAGPYLLTRSGTHRLEVVGYADGDYNFRLVTGDSATALSFGTTYTQTPDPGFRTDFYRFTGTVGQRLFYDALDIDFNPVNVRIYNPNGGINFINGNADSDVGPFIITEPGTYYLVLEGFTPDGTGDYSFRLIDMAQSPAAPLVLGATVNGTLNPGTEVDWYRFSGTAGQRIYFDGASTNTGGSWYLYGPENQGLNSAGLNGDFQQILPQTGTYLVAVYGNGTDPVPYSFRAYAGGTTTNALTLGATVSGTIAQPDQEFRYTFTGTAGQRLVYDALDTDGDSLRVYLIGPSGGVVHIDQGAESDAGPFTLTDTGPYTLVLRGYGEAVGSFRFRLLDPTVAPSQPLALDTTVTGVLDPGTAVQLFTFSGSTGQRLFFDGAATNTAGAAYLYDQNNSGLWGVGLNSDVEVILPRNTTYLLLLTHGATNPVPYSFRVVTPTTTTNAYVLGTSVTNAVTEQGQEFRYTFTGTPGQRLVYDALDTDGDSLRVYLLNPSGNVVFIDQNAENDNGPFTLTDAGTYTLALRGYGEALGTFRFRLLDPAVAPTQTLTLDTTVNGVLDPGTAIQLFTFSGSTGQRLFFDGAATNTAGAAYLYDQNNGSLWGVSLNGDAEVILPRNTTYLLLFTHSATNPVPYSFRIVTPATTTNAYVLGTGVTNTLTEPGEEHRYTFTGTAGQRLFYDALEADFDGVNVYLYDPFGNNTIIGGNADSDVGLFTLPHSGTWTLLFKTGSQTVGDYRFRLYDLATAPLITYGTTVTAQLSPQIETDLYRINGTVGQRLSISNIAASSGNANWYLYRPDNSTPLGAGIGSHLGEITLPSSGTYAIAIIGSSDLIGTLDYQFRVTLLSSSNGTPAGFDVVRTGTTTAGQTNTYTFTGTAGLPIYLDNQTNNSIVCHYLFDPSGELVVNICPGSDSGPYILATNGTYTLNVVGQGAGDFQFRWLNLNGSAVTNLSFGTTYSVQPPAYWTDVYRFTGTAGQRLIYDSLEYEFDAVSARIFNPSGGNVFLSGNADSEPGPFTLTESGTYYLVMESSGDNPPPDYSFRLIDATQAPATALAFDTQINGLLDPGTRADVYRFNGAAGQKLFMDAMPTNSGAAWYLYGPQNQQLSGAGLASDFEVTLPQTGQYLLLAGFGSDTNPQPYSFRVVTPTNTTNALAFGATINGTLSEPGESDYYTFTGTVGQRLVYDALDNDFDNVTVQLVTPSGNAPLHHNADSDSAPITLTESGTYTVRLYTGDDVVRDYSFRIIDAAQAPAVALTLDTQIEAVLVPGTRQDVYRFNGTAGQKVFMDAMPTNSGAAWYLYGPQNQQLSGAGLASDFEVTLPQTGQYLLLAGFGSDTNPAPYSIRVVTPTDSTNAFAVGAIVAGTLSEPGESDYYTFTGTTGQRLVYDALDNDFDNVSMRLITPSGNVRFNQNADSDIGPFTLFETGTYTVHFFAGDAVMRDYRFRLLDAASAPLLAYDVVVTNNITNSFGAVIYQVPGLAGLRLFVDGLVPGDGSASYYLYEPDNTQLTGTTLGYDMEATPTLTGTQLLVLYSSVSADVPYSFRIVPGNHAPVLAAIGNLIVNEESNLTFTASTTDLELPNDVLTWSIENAPVGSTFNPLTGEFSWTPTEAQGSNTYTVTIRVRDDGIPSLEDSETFDIRVNEINRPPVITVPGTQTIDELTLLNVTATATDPDIPANALTFSLVSGPSGLNVAANGAITWTPTEAQGPGTYPVSVRVTDLNPLAVNEQSLSATGTFNVVVREINVPPVFTGPANQTVVEGDLLSVNATATDSDIPVNALSYSLISGPAGLNVAASGAITWTPTEAQGSNTYSVSVRVTDNNPDAVNTQQLSATNTFTVTVLESNRPPVLTLPSNQTIAEETPLSVTATATDPDLPANALTFALVSGPSGLNVAAGGGITWTPTEAQGSNTYTVTVRVTDNNPTAFNAQQISVTNSFTVTVLESNRPPALTGPGNQTVVEDNPLSVSATATDPDDPANALTYALISGPSGLNVAANGAITWTPTEAQGSNAYTVTIRVTDNNPTAFNTQQLSATNSFVVTVLESNRPPVLTGPGNQTVVEDNPLSVNATATDPDDPANALTYALISGPSGLSVAANGAITWTPTEAQGSNAYTVTVRVTDNNPTAFNAQQLSATNSFVVTVLESNRPPVMTGPGNQTIVEETALNVTATATDPDLPANALTFALISGPSGLNVAANGAITWTPTEAQGSNTYTVTVRVTDNNPTAFNAQQLSGTNSFTVTVLESNRPPVLTLPGTQTVPELVPLNLTATATDPDLPANSLTFALVSGPSGLAVAANGDISWTPAEDQGPTNYTVTVRLTDSGSPSLSHTQSFQINVQEVNSAPSLAAIPGRTVHAGTLVSVTAVVTDSDVPTNTFTFSLLNPPAGAVINSTNGALTWTPSDAQLGTTNIQVRVADSGSPSLSATQGFNVRVVSRPLMGTPVYSNGTAGLTWSAITNISYRLQFKNDLNLTNWSNVAGDVIATTTNATKLDTNAVSSSNRFYQILVLP